MDRHLKEVVIWVILALTIITIGAEMLLGANHSSDNSVKIQQIQKGIK